MPPYPTASTELGYTRRTTTGARDRRRNRRRVDIAGGIRLAFLLLLVGECLRVAFFSPRMNLVRVDVEGRTRYSTEEIARKAGITYGRNIFTANLGSAYDRLMSDPVFESVELSRNFPDTLQIRVAERRPALRVVCRGEAYHADQGGRVFEIAGRVPDPDSALPEMSLESGTPPLLGDRIPEELLSCFWECVDLSRKESLDLARVRVDASQDLWLNVIVTSARASEPSVGLEAPRTRTLPVKLGRWTDLPDKFRDVRLSLSGPAAISEASYLNVMCPGSPAYMSAATAQ